MEAHYRHSEEKKTLLSHNYKIVSHNYDFDIS